MKIKNIVYVFVWGGNTSDIIGYRADLNVEPSTWPPVVGDVMFLNNIVPFGDHTFTSLKGKVALRAFVEDPSTIAREMNLPAEIYLEPLLLITVHIL